MRFLFEKTCMILLASLLSVTGVYYEICFGVQTNQPESKGPGPYPIVVTVGAKGAIFVVDKELKTVFRVDQDNKLKQLYKGSRKYRTPLYNVMTLATDSAGNLFLGDTGSMDVWRLSPEGKLTPMTGQKIARGIAPPPTDQNFDPDGAYAGKFDKPMGVTVDSDGSVVVADLGLAAIFRIPAEGGDPQEIARVPAPHGIARDREGGFVVVSHGKDQLVRVNANGEVAPIVRGSLAPRNFPHNVAVDQAGYIVTDGYAKAVWRVTLDGKVSPIVQGEPLINPVGLALESDGNILVADPHAKKLFRVTLEGQISTVASFVSDEK